MKKLLFATFFSLLSLSSISSFSQNNDAPYKSYGAEFEAQSVLSPARIPYLINNPKSTENIQLIGYISEVCQNAGCWIKINTDLNSHENLMVKTKHEFVVPKDIAGKRVLVYGSVSEKEISVEEQKHLLEDAGASQEEIDKITQPKKDFVMIAKGMKVYEE